MTSLKLTISALTLILPSSGLLRGVRWFETEVSVINYRIPSSSVKLFMKKLEQLDP
jgi:hypothetical protein